MNFRDQAVAHLTKYKEQQLQIQEPGIHARTGNLYGHILPEGYKFANFLPPYRDAFLQSKEYPDIKLHSGFHHLNSSQVMCINFFYPLMKENLLEKLLPAFHLVEQPVLRCELEWKDELAREEGTNFDFFMQLADVKKLLFEVKYTEAEFDRKRVTANNIYASHQQKYKDLYAKRLEGTLLPQFNTCENVLANYQLFRNMSYVKADNDNYLIVICPRRSTKLKKQYGEAYGQLLPGVQRNVQYISWEDITAYVQRQFTGQSLAQYYEQFAEKYLF